MRSDRWAHVSETDLGTMTSRPLTPERFPDMVEVFGERGVARNCFCMYWRTPKGGFEDHRDNRDRFADVARDERPPGLIGYVEDNPVGWVQVGPRHRVPDSRPLTPPQIRRRRRDLVDQLLRGARRPPEAGSRRRAARRCHRVRQGPRSGRHRGISGRWPTQLIGGLFHRDTQHVRRARVRRVDPPQRFATDRPSHGVSPISPIRQSTRWSTRRPRFSSSRPGGPTRPTRWRRW